LKPLKQEKSEDWDEEDEMGYIGEEINEL